MPRVSIAEKEKSARLKGVAECSHKVVEEKQCVSLKTLAVTGRDLIQAGYKPGPELGEVLKEMLEHVLEEPSDNTREVNGIYKRKTLEVYRRVTFVYRDSARRDMGIF